MNKAVTVVVGGQFGSEAKGKVVSYLAGEFDLAIRTGSPNAGHTVFSDEDKMYQLQQIPATFLNSDCVLCIGAGSLIDPEVLKKEVAATNTTGRIIIDPLVGVIQPKHKEQESELVANIASTGKGCGAALVDRIWRKNFDLAKDTLNDYQIDDVSALANTVLAGGGSVVVEGTQGFGLSLYHGTYPHVTSRDTTAAGFLAEAGLSPMLVKEIILVVRTYPIRVAGNSGPLPNEISWDELSKRVGAQTVEHTTVTKKVRRVAEFDMELVKKAIQVNGPTQIALQFLNYLFPEDLGKNSWKNLSDPAKNYISKLEKELGVPITLIGTSQQNSGMIDLRSEKL